MEEVWSLPEGAARHAQVLRLQPGAPLVVFDGRGGQWAAEVVEMQRKAVTVRLVATAPGGCELPVGVTLAVGMPANERMDFLVEKAAELGVQRIQPLMCARSVLRLDGERAQRKVAHWQAVAVAACEQSGRTWVPEVSAVRTLSAYLKAGVAPGARLGVLSPRATRSLVEWSADAPTVGSAGAAGAASAARTSETGVTAAAGEPGDADAGWWGAASGLADDSGGSWCLLSGPEGGLTEEEEALARAMGWEPLSLGRRVLRADTAPLAALAILGALQER